jgi:hypothetical protein
MNTLKRTHVAAVGFILSLGILFGTYLAGRQQGYKEGRNKGYDEGLIDGIEKGSPRVLTPECPPCETVFIHE